MRYLVLLIAALPLSAQVKEMYPMQDFVENWKTTKAFTLAVAQAMPAEEYGFKPTSEEMSFAVLMFHIAGANAFRFAQVAGVKNPMENPGKIAKEDAKRIAIDYMTKSFDFCIDQLSKLTTEQLNRMNKVDWVGRPEASGRMVLMNMFVHTAHHRAQAEVYLRLKGIKPPEYKF